MSFDPFQSDLPVTEIIGDVRSHLRQGNTLIVHAPPGAGKSTLLPLSLMEEPWLQRKKILMLEPRRLAARSIAYRMASLLQEEVGRSIGYRIRFENRSSADTSIEVLTEGILTRMIHQDNALEGVGLVIFDEFHERSIHSDVALALCREVQQILRPDLRIMLMSATLDIPNLSRLLSAPVAESKGRQYTVDIFYGGEQDLGLLPEMTARTILQAVGQHQGDLLAFLPGEAEIRKCEALLSKALPDFAIHPLYSQLPQSVQNRALVPDRNGKRKVVLATSIAETSLTIEGIRIVVDCGFSRTSRFAPSTGLSRLETVQISRDSADQRAGRAGRLGPGACYRMWSRATHERLAAHRTPEILEADLAPLVLDMAQWGIENVQQLTWLNSPPAAPLAQASEMLHQLEALQHGRITDHGKAIHRLPCHPRIAHMLLMAGEDSMLALATDIAAILEEKDPLPRGSGIDINLRIEALRRFRQGNGQGKFSRIEKVAASYRKMFGIQEDNSLFDPYETGVLLAHAYPERIAYVRPGNNAQFQLANGSYATAGHTDDLAHEPWLAVAHVDARDGRGKIFMASPLNPKDLAPLVREKEIISWDTAKGGLIASRDLKIGCIVLQSRPLANPGKELVIEAITQAIQKEGDTLLNFDEEVEQWQARVMSLRHWREEEDWPDVSTAVLLRENLSWLGPYLEQVKRTEDFKRLRLLDILHHHLAWEKQKALDQLAPQKISVPSGSHIGLQYQADGSPPVLAVRLQEVFGMADTPRINEGKTPVLMHLLSPGFKPVQVTSDLRSFWNNTYFEVKKELKRRYPKHAWPEDPWTAEAIRGVKRKQTL